MTDKHKLFEKLGIKDYDPQENITSYTELLRSPERQTHQFVYLLQGTAARIANSSYLRGEWDLCRQWSRTAGERTLEFFFGDWRFHEKHDDGRIDPDAWYNEEDADYWCTYIVEGLAWSAIGGHWDLVGELLTFPSPKIAPDPNEGKVSHAYYCGLARWWRDNDDVSWIEEVKGIRGAGSKAYHLLADTVGAIAKNDPDAAAKPLTKYVQMFLKRRDHEEQFPLAATLLWNIALHKGMKPPVPEELAIYLFSLPREA